MESHNTISNILLPHDSINNDGFTTIVLIHGGGANRRTWNGVISHLPSQYHVLVPDLPSHGRAGSIKPFTLEICTQLLALLIKAKAHNGRANLVGLSLGAYVVIDLAVQHPELTESVFASGYNRFNPSFFTPYLAKAAWTADKLPSILPKAVVKYFMDGADMAELKDDATPSYERHKQFMALLTTGAWPKPWAARTLIVAATRGGLVPSFDKPAVAKKLVEICRKGGNGDVRAVQRRDMRHPWNSQDPRLFADAVCSFIEQRSLPVGFEEV